MRLTPTMTALVACATVLCGQQRLPTGQLLTPLAAPGAKLQALNPHLADDPGFTADGAVSSVLSPDGRTLLVLTSGYNDPYFASGPRAGQHNPADSGDFIFAFDVSATAPRQTQALKIGSTFGGLAFAPDGQTFYASGGDEDCVHVFQYSGGQWSERLPALALGHTHGLGDHIKPEAAGIAVSPDGKTLAVANFENDSLSVLPSDGSHAPSELDLRPGGEFPDWVAFRGNQTIYVSSPRDREVVEVGLGPEPHVTARIALVGEPNRMVLNRAGTRLYVTQDNADTVAVVDTSTGRVLEEIPVAAPVGLVPRSPLRFGAIPNALALSPDERTLYVTDAGENALAVVDVGRGETKGLIPTGWFPSSVTPARNGRTVYVLNAKSPGGANPLHDRGLTAARRRAIHAANQYVLQLEKSQVLMLPVPGATALGWLTRQVLANDHLQYRPAEQQRMVIAGLRQRIHHVIYIIKENRTYDQVLGDLAGTNGDPALVEFPQANTPNFHAFARDFVALDHFLCSGGVSGQGWPWSTSARTTDLVEKEVLPNYAGRGLSYDFEGESRNLSLVQPRPRGLLPGTANPASPDGSEGDRDEAGQGYLWDAALRHGLSVRNYGDFAGGNYDQSRPHAIPELLDPAASHTVVAYADSPSLRPYTDPYFRGFDQTFPDFYRYQEWKREFDGYVRDGKLPALETIRMEHDHFGNFKTALDGLDTPERQIADDDYAVGLLVEAVAHSRYRNDTLVFVVEDDAQDGGDHVDAHRSPAFILGPYVRHHAVVSTPYDTVGLVRTIEAVLGLAPMNINDAGAAPMADVFDLSQSEWNYTATPSRYLFGTGLPIPHTAAALTPTHDRAYWARITEGMDFSIADHLDSARFNRLLWQGLRGAGHVAGK